RHVGHTALAAFCAGTLLRVLVLAAVAWAARRSIVFTALLTAAASGSSTWGLWPLRLFPAWRSAGIRRTPCVATGPAGPLAPRSIRLTRLLRRRCLRLVTERLQQRRSIDHGAQRWVLVGRSNDLGPTGLELFHALLDLVVKRGAKEDRDSSQDRKQHGAKDDQVLAVLQPGVPAQQLA